MSAPWITVVGLGEDDRLGLGAKARVAIDTAAHVVGAERHFAILGTGALVKRPVVINDKDLGEVIAVRDMMYLSMSYDHRLVDGADAARFLSTLKARLEEGDFGSEFGL